jgi:hypothetical protein
MVVPTTVNKALVLYNAMAAAIDKCHTVDLCSDIVDKSIALTAYYKQIKDEETERKFIEIRLRAWRRISELFANALKGLKPEKYKSAGQEHYGITTKRKVERIRKSFDEKATAGMSDMRILELIKLSQVSKKDFEDTMENRPLTGSLGNFFDNTPDVLAQRERNIAEAAERERLAQAQAAIDKTPKGGVGITLEPSYRKQMRTVNFIISEDLHRVLRQAAFDQHLTMHEVLRQGLRMWLKEHNYEIDIEEEENA